MKVKSLSRVRLFMTPWTAAYQAPPSMGFSRQEDWSGEPLPSPVVAAGASKQGTGIRISVMEGVRECSIVSPTPHIITQENGEKGEKGVSGLSSDPC